MPLIQSASGAMRWLSTIVQHHVAGACSYAKQQHFERAYAPHRAAKRCSRLLGMAGTDPSNVVLDLKSISQSSMARGACLRINRMTNCHARARSHLRLVASEHRDADAARGSLPVERINQCMLLLFVICVVLAGSIVGAVGYLAGE